MKWFGVKKKSQSGDLYEMAQKLHLERRLHPRVRLAHGDKVFFGPTLKYEGKSFPIWDISEGGVCILDHDDAFRSKIGQRFDLEIFCPGKFKISAKLVGSNLNRRHIQFENPSADFVEDLRPWISMGLRGTWMRDLLPNTKGPDRPVRFKMFLGSILDDSMVSSTDMRWEYDLNLQGKKYCLSLSSWPSIYGRNGRITPLEFDMLLTFLANIEGKNLENHGSIIERLQDVRKNE